MAAAPNILLIVSDQHHAEAMSCRSGPAFLHTPALDRLAGRGTVFSRAYTASPVCIPARNALFAGLHPHQTGIQCNRSHPGNPGAGWPDDGARLPPSIRGLGAYFAEGGYDTAYFGKWHLKFDPTHHAHHGFAVTEVLENKGHDEEIARAAARYLRSGRNRPFLAVVAFCDPHDICQWATGRPLPGGELPAPPAADRLPPAPANLGPTRHAGDMLETLREGYRQVHAPPDGDARDEVRRARELAWAYHRLIERVDARIGEVLGALDGSGHGDRTLVVYTSDHGELQGAHGLVQKSFFYEEAVHVPLMIALPDGGPATCDHLASPCIDLLPTLLEAAGLPRPESLPGRSLWPVLRGDAPEDGREFVVGQVHFCSPKLPAGVPHVYGRMVRSSRHSYWLFDQGRQREVLFDTETDPGETLNLAGSGDVVGILRQHRAYLRRHAEETADTQAADMLRALPALIPPPGTPAPGPRWWRE